MCHSGAEVKLCGACGSVAGSYKHLRLGRRMSGEWSGRHSAFECSGLMVELAPEHYTLLDQSTA